MHRERDPLLFEIPLKQPLSLSLSLYSNTANTMRCSESQVSIPVTGVITALRRVKASGSAARNERSRLVTGPHNLSMCTYEARRGEEPSNGYGCGGRRWSTVYRRDEATSDTSKPNGWVPLEMV